MADRAPMKLGSVPATIMVVTLVVVAALLYFLTRDDPQESDVVAPPVGTESAEPPPADDDTADRVQPQEPTGESETADPADQPSEDKMDADEDSERDRVGEPEGTILPEDSVPMGETGTADPADRQSEVELDADEGAERDRVGEPEGTILPEDSVPMGETETADPADRPSEVDLDADEGTERDRVGEPEGTILPGDTAPAGESETADLEVGPSDGEMDAEESAERDVADETEATVRTGDAVSIEPESTEKSTATTPDPIPTIDQPADGVAELGEPVSGKDVSGQPADTVEMADRLAPGDETPPDSGFDPCDGIQSMTDDADATAEGIVPCPDETVAPADEADTAPESRVPAEGQVADGASGDGTGDEVPEDAAEATESAGETVAPADEADTAPESRVPAEGQVADGASGDGTGEEVPEDAAEATESAGETVAPAEEADSAPESRVPTEGQVGDGASGDGTGDEVPEDAAEATESAGETVAPADEADSAPESRVPAEGQVADGASGEGTGDETPPESEFDPCDGIQSMTDAADAAADGAVPCPDETVAPADEADTAPESRAPTDGQVADGASGDGTGDEVPEDAAEATESAGETVAPADEADTAPESRVPAEGQVADGASGEGTGDETPPESEFDPCDGIQSMTDAADAAADGAVPCPDETVAPADETDTAPESRAPTDGQVADGASGDGTGEEVSEDAVEATAPAGETDESTAESLPGARDTLPDVEELEQVEALSKAEDQACPDDPSEDPLDEVGTDGRSPCPDEIQEVDQPDVDSEPTRTAPTEPDAGSEKAAEVPGESAADGKDDASAPPESLAKSNVGPTLDGKADAVTPEAAADVGTTVAEEADSAEKTALSDDTGKEPEDGAPGPSPDPVQTAKPASEQPGDSLETTEIDDGSVGDVGSASGLPDEKMGSVPESKEIVDLEAADDAPVSSTAEITEDTAIDGESPVAESMQEDLTPPSFDLVRVDRFGTTVLAGRAPVDSLVEALVDGEVAGSQSAGRIGQFAMIFSVDTQRDTLAIGLRATLPDGRSVASDSSVFVVVPHGRMMPVNPVVEEGTGIESVAPIELPTTKLADLEELQPSVLLATNEGVRLIQPSVPDDEGKLLVEIVSYDEEGEVFIAGSTRSDGGRISIFLDGELVKSTEISPGGSWWTDLKGVKPGRYRLRVEEFDLSGTVVASVEMPFQKEAPEHAREMLSTASKSREVETTGADQGPIISLLAVQRGFTLWGISRKNYGLGRLYVNIFEANRDQIDNPHLIYPGQIFILPDESQLVDPLW